jgi:hypothetical protein
LPPWASVIALTACGDAAGPNGDRLSRAEAIALSGIVLAQSEGAAAISATVTADGSAGLENAGPPTTFTWTHTSTHPCPSGGELAIQFTVDGTYEEEINALQADLTGSHVHDDCAFPHNGSTFTVDGRPSIAFTASVGAIDGTPSQPFTFTLDGAFGWAANDGRSGLCEMTLSAVTDFLAQSRNVQGSVCGHTIDQTLTWN